MEDLHALPTNTALHRTLTVALMSFDQDDIAEIAALDSIDKLHLQARLGCLLDILNHSDISPCTRPQASKT